MAKSARSSSKKNNHQRTAKTIFGPAEKARAERLSAKLLEVANAPKPESSDVNMDEEKAATPADAETTMEVDSARPSKSRVGKKRIDKRRQKKASIVFPKYSDKVKAKRKKAAAAASALLKRLG